MNENLDLVKILKNCPIGTKLYSLIHGEVTLDEIGNPTDEYPILVITEQGCNHKFTIDGRFYFRYKNSECVLFPSEHQRDWSKFKVPVEKFDYSTLKPFDKVLVRNGNGDKWVASHYSYMSNHPVLKYKIMKCDACWEQGIPYNDETKHLVGTSDMSDQKYIWWEEEL